MSNSYNTLALETDRDGVALLTVNRPDKMNALNAEVLDELSEAIEFLAEDDDVSAVIVTGAGEKAFVAGADIGELRELDSRTGKEFSRKGQRVFRALEELPVPVVAAVNGYALGGGCELAMACHLRVASASAVFGLPEVGLGIIPGYGGTQRLPRIVGRSRALEMILSGRQVKAEEALKIGLADRAGGDDPVGEARELLNKILGNGPLAVRNALRAVCRTGTEEDYGEEAELFADLCDTDDFNEGTSAFLEKRKADFKGQ